MDEESVESYVDISRKRHLPVQNDRYDTKRTNQGSQQFVLKFLVPNHVAGMLIGKGGSNITELQNKFDATIQVSSNKEFYPGTEERVVAITADKDQIVEFNNYMMAGTQNEDEESNENRKLSTSYFMKLIVSNAAAGLVIGKGGSTIKSIQEENDGIGVHISKREEGVMGERIIIITGDMNQKESGQLTKAFTHITEILAAEPDMMSNTTVKYNTFNNGSNSNGVGTTGNHHGNHYSNSSYQPSSKAKSKFYVEMDIPDDMVGILLGKQGSTISEISRESGARLKFSAKDEFVPGTTDRLLTITGGMYQVQNAYMLVDLKVAQLEREGSNRRQ